MILYTFYDSATCADRSRCGADVNLGIVYVSKRVLIIGFLYPLVHAGGSYRTLPLAKYLPEFGWETVVLTPTLEVKVDLPFRVIETPYRDSLASWKKLVGLKPTMDTKKQVQAYLGTYAENVFVSFVMSCIGAVVNYPDAYRGWIPIAFEAAERVFREEKIDVVINTHPVATTSLVAAELKTRYGVPWVVDFADLWSQNHYYRYGPIRRAMDTRLEKKTLRRADTLVTVAPHLSEILKRMYPDKPVHMLPHGFDPEEVNTSPGKLTDTFTITYTGSVYAGKQDMDMVFSVLQELFDEGKMDRRKTEVRFYGHPVTSFTSMVAKYDLTDVVHHYGFLPRKDMLPRQRESQVLLVTNWEGRERSMFQLKEIEYLAARRPILATGGVGNDLTCELLETTKAGSYAPLREDVKKALAGYYQEYERNGAVPYRGDPAKLDTYSYRQVAGQFADMLERLTDGFSTPTEAIGSDESERHGIRS